jgi:hypothetical protein
MSSSEVLTLAQHLKVWLTVHETCLWSGLGKGMYVRTYYYNVLLGQDAIKLITTYTCIRKVVYACTCIRTGCKLT